MTTTPDNHQTPEQAYDRWEVTIECTKRNQQGDVVEMATATLVHSCQPNPGNCA